MRRVFAVVVSAVLVVAAAHESVRAAPEPATVMSRIRSTGRLTLGYRADARPFAYTDASGKPAGYSVSLCQRVADEAKRHFGLPALQVEWVPVAFAQRFSALRLGEIDLLCGADTVTLARRSEADFSIPIFPGGIGGLLRSDSSPRLREVLSGRGQPFHPVWRANATQLLRSRDFAVVEGTTADTWLGKRMNDLDVLAGIASVKSYNDGIQRILDRRSDVFFGDRAILLETANHHSGGHDLVVLDRLFTQEPLALALAPGDVEFRLLVDRALSRLYRSADFAPIYTNTFGEPDQTTLTFFRWNALPE